MADLVPVAIPALILSAFYTLFLSPSAWARQIVKQPLFADSISLQATMDHLSRTTSTRQNVTTSWKTIDDIVMDDQLIYFFYADGNGFPVPKAAFPSLSVAESFYKTVLQYWKSAKDGTTIESQSDDGSWPPPPSLNKPR